MADNQRHVWMMIRHVCNIGGLKKLIESRGGRSSGWRSRMTDLQLKFGSAAIRFRRLRRIFILVASRISEMIAWL